MISGSQVVAIEVKQMKARQQAVKQFHEQCTRKVVASIVSCYSPQITKSSDEPPISISSLIAQRSIASNSRLYILLSLPTLLYPDTSRIVFYFVPYTTVVTNSNAILLTIFFELLNAIESKDSRKRVIFKNVRGFTSLVSLSVCSRTDLEIRTA